MEIGNLSIKDSLEESDALIVSLDEIISFDRTLMGIIHLPKGKQAFRESIGGTWRVYEWEGK